jgi:hypothetical protein
LRRAYPGQIASERNGRCTPPAELLHEALRLNGQDAFQRKL